MFISMNFQVIPPPEWQAKSKDVDPEFVLEKVHTQKCSALLLGAKQVFFGDEEVSKSYAQFAEDAFARDDDATVAEIEDAFWSKGIEEPRKYSIENELSLFGDDVMTWNLNTFTSNQSNIHAAPYFRDVRMHSIFPILF